MILLLWKKLREKDIVKVILTPKINPLEPFKARMINGNRLTIPEEYMLAFQLKVGDSVKVEISKVKI